ncbi:class I SAM-dependent methyltransferase [Longimicrobium sp.]|uniref:class I SAM-dependent methyltransferase n=1 Tax=Longimicrobium sp. TaxID=2029185 RepID=UPI003B3BAB0B
MSESAYARSTRFYDLIYVGKPYEQEAEFLHDRIQAHLRSDGNALLDVGCGTGSHLAHLRRHYRCDGVDVDAGFLAIARERYPDSAFHQHDMADFDLDRRYDALVCLFSAIGYVKTNERLRQTMRTFARHLLPGGVAVVEPWLTPDTFIPGHVRTDTPESPRLKVARMVHSGMRGDLSVLTFSYLIGSAEGIEHFEEHHELGLFTTEQMLDAIHGAGLEVVEHDPRGLTGRGLYFARQPG